VAHGHILDLVRGLVAGARGGVLDSCGTRECPGVDHLVAVGVDYADCLTGAEGDSDAGTGGDGVGCHAGDGVVAGWQRFLLRTSYEKPGKGRRVMRDGYYTACWQRVGVGSECV